jgi:hypothetical protein
MMAKVSIENAKMLKIIILINPFFQPSHNNIAAKQGIERNMIKIAEILDISGLILTFATKNAAIIKAMAVIQIYFE